MKAVRAPWMVTEPGCLVADGALLHDQGRILAAGRWADLRAQLPVGGTVEDVEDAVLFPGLINAHCHLDYSNVGSVGEPGNTFPVWLEKMGRCKRGLTEKDVRKAIVAGARAAVSSGTTTLCSVAAFPRVLAKVPLLALRVWWFLEMTDMRSPCPVDRIIHQAGTMLPPHNPGANGGFGLAPHAPYTASRRLYEECTAAAQKHGLPWTTHLAESSAEWEMFQHGTGPLAEFLQKMGKSLRQSKPVTPLQQVLVSGSYPAGLILVHGNYWSEEDLDLLKKAGPQVALVHCPSSHRFFQHREFSWEQMRAVGVRVAFGTDSPATGGGLDLREELRIFHQKHPETDPRDLWQAVTTIPATMLPSLLPLGALRPGAAADFLCWEVPGTLRGRELLEGLIHTTKAPRRVVISSRDVIATIPPSE